MEHRGLFSALVDRPILTLMITLATVMVGVVSFLKLPLRFAPEGLTENQINIFVPVSSRTPTEVEDKVTRPLEELLRTIPGIEEVKSDSNDDYAQLWVELDSEMDTTLAAAEVRDRLQRAKLQWPADVDNYFTWREDASSVPLAFFQMLTPETNPEWDFLLDKVVGPRLEAVDGVGRIDIWGLLEETIRIWFDRDKVIAHRVDYYRLIQRLAADNFAEPIGEIDDGSHRYLARVDTKFKQLDDILNYPVKPGLVLADIARVERVPAIRNSLSRFNQKYTYSGMISAASDTNPVDASARLHEAVAQLKRDPRLASLEFRFLFDQGAMITDSLETLLKTSLQGGVLALIALVLFLRNFRFTLAIAMAIPLALLIVGGWLFFAGSSLNILTMAGMTLAVGMVVDNSVVVLESIRRLREHGAPLRQACVQGAREVGLAVAMATLTTVVVILPMVFFGKGQTRVLLTDVGVPLSVALIGSLLTALLLLPSGLYHLGGTGKVVSTPKLGGAVTWTQRLSPVYWLMRFNAGLLRAALRHRVIATLAALSVLGSGYYPWDNLEFSADGGGIFRRGDIAVYMDLPRGMDLNDVEREVITYEDFVLEHKDEWRVDSVSSRFSRRSITVDIVTVDDVESDELAETRKVIEAAWPRRPGVEVKLRDASVSMGGSSAEKAERSFVMRLYGRDTRFLRDLAEEVRGAIAALPEVDKVEVPQMDATEEVIVTLDRDRMQELQVRPDVLQGTVASGLHGQALTEFEENGRETKLIAEFDAERNPTLLDLKETQVLAGSNTFQRLANVSDIRFQNSLGSIERADGRTHVTIVGRRAPDIGPLALSRRINDVMRRFPMPRGYTWREESQFLESQQQMGELLDALGLGVTLVFLLMGVLFESVILPGSILFTVPFALLGGLWSIWLFYGSLDPMAFVGAILLAGIIVNNGIVLLDCISRLRREGMDREHAILEGTRRRLRPIVMTAVTTIFGLLPMAVFGESSGQGLSYVSLSITVAGGLALSTIFTAFIVPLAYTFMDDLSGWMAKVWGKSRYGV